MERPEAARYAAPYELASDAASESRFHLVQHDLLLLSDGRVGDALVGSGHSSKLPGPALDRRRLHVASYGPAADRRQRAVLRLAKQSRAVGRSGTGDGSRAGAEHPHEIPVARFISCAGAERLHLPRA